MGVVSSKNKLLNKILLWFANCTILGGGVSGPVANWVMQTRMSQGTPEGNRLTWCHPLLLLLTAACSQEGWRPGASPCLKWDWLPLSRQWWGYRHISWTLLPEFTVLGVYPAPHPHGCAEHGRRSSLLSLLPALSHTTQGRPLPFLWSATLDHRATSKENEDESSV